MYFIYLTIDDLSSLCINYYQFSIEGHHTLVLLGKPRLSEVLNSRNV